MTNIEAWWPKLPAHIRLELAENPRGPLSADAVIAITHAAGVGPTLTQWEGQPPAPAHLTDAEVDWIEQRDEEDLADDAEQDATDVLGAVLDDFPREI